MRLLVVRHAPVATKGLCYGQSDVPTTLDHDAACDTIAAQLASLPPPITRVWC